MHTFTRFRIRKNGLADPMASGTEHSDWAMMVQAGAGVMVAVNSSRNTFPEPKVRRVFSEQMDFLTKKRPLTPNRENFGTAAC